MNSSNEGSKQQQPLPEKQFFGYFFSHSSHPQEMWKSLKEKYRYYKQQSYNVSKTSSQISYLKKFTYVCNYLPFVGQIRSEKIEIPLIQQTIQVIYNDFETFFSEGGWRAVKNKSLKAHLQEYLLLKLYKTHHSLKAQAGLDSFILAFFYTLNYYKTCNYEIRLFNDFLLNTDLESFFIFILLRKKSRRVNRDLSIKSQHITAFVRVLKGERSFPSLGSYTSENEQMGQVKLLLIYPEIIEFINNNGIVLHEILIYSLLKCSDITRDPSSSIFQKPTTDWHQFFALYFQNTSSGDNCYRQEIIKRVLKANLKMGETLFKPFESSMTFVQDKNQPKQQFLQQSFQWLIGVLQGIISDKQNVKQEWRTMYAKLSKLYELNLSLGNKLVQQIFKSQEYSKIYQKHSRKGSNSAE